MITNLRTHLNLIIGPDKQAISGSYHFYFISRKLDRNHRKPLKYPKLTIKAVLLFFVGRFGVRSIGGKCTFYSKNSCS